MQVTALDEADKKVDWPFIYKVPQLSAGATTDKTKGYEYVYYDSSIMTSSCANPEIYEQARLDPEKYDLLRARMGRGGILRDHVPRTSSTPSTSSIRNARHGRSSGSAHA
jgi:hypothetical protein